MAQVWPSVRLPALADRLPWLAARAALIDSLVLAPPTPEDNYGEVDTSEDVTAQAVALPGLDHLKVHLVPSGSLHTSFLPAERTLQLR